MKLSTWCEDNGVDLNDNIIDFIKNDSNTVAYDNYKDFYNNYLSTDYKDRPYQEDVDKEDYYLEELGLWVETF